MAPQRNLVDLPLEILQQIASLVRDTNRPSFHALCATNKTYRLACLPLIFSELHISVDDDRALQNDIDLLLKSLSSAVCGIDVTQYVRHLHLKGSMSLTNDRDDETEELWDDAERAAEYEKTLQLFRAHGLDELLDENEPLMDCYLGESNPFVSPKENMAWTPVADLMKTLPRLSKLVYNCHSQFPPNLLNVLHSHHPKCRLYHHTFRLRSLTTKYGRLDPHELAVATSPCLYSVKLRYSYQNEDQEVDHNIKALLELVAGLAPNLKEVFVVCLPAEPTHRWDPPQIHPDQRPWRGLPGFIPGQTGSLTLLSITGRVPWSTWFPDSFQKWANCTDFSSLRHLSLGGAYDLKERTRECCQGLNTAALECIARASSFPQLESLHIVLIRRSDLTEGVDLHTNADFIDAATALFDKLPPLKKLSVAGSISPEILDTILARHGRTLVELKLHPFEDAWARVTDPISFVPMTFTSAHFMQIKAQCPVLESLSIYIKRTMSDPSEVELYKSLARIKPLQSLFLTLDCSDWRVLRDPDVEYESQFDEDDQELFPYFSGLVKRGHIRQNLINCAVDETLARSIWDVIANHKDGNRLVSLKLYTAGGLNFGRPGTSHEPGHTTGPISMVHHLSRSWAFERGPRDDQTDALHVRDLGQKGRQARDKGMRKLVAEEALHYSHNHLIDMYLFRSIWPATKKVPRPWLDMWFDDWTSYPLQI